MRRARAERKSPDWLRFPLPGGVTATVRFDGAGVVTAESIRHLIRNLELTEAALQRDEEEASDGR